MGYLSVLECRLVCLSVGTPFRLCSSEESSLLFETGNGNHLTWLRDKRTACQQNLYLVSPWAPPGDNGANTDSR